MKKKINPILLILLIVGALLLINNLTTEPQAIATSNKVISRSCNKPINQDDCYINLAYDTNGDGVLEQFIPEYCNHQLPCGDRGYEETGDQFRFETSATGYQFSNIYMLDSNNIAISFYSNGCRKFVRGGTCPTTNEPLEEYRGDEICEGGSSYNPNCQYECIPVCDDSSKCVGQLYLDSCGGYCEGTKPRDCSCAANTCVGATCSDGCEGICQGTKEGCQPIGCNTDADTDCDGKVSWTEINVAVNKWLSGLYSWTEINNFITIWLEG